MRKTTNLIGMFVLTITLITAGLLANTLSAHAQSIEWNIRKNPEHNKLMDQVCYDYYRRPVLNVKNDTLSDVAYSDLMRMRGVNMGPMTIINIKRLTQLSKASQYFFIAHECGHHALGHLYFKKIGLKAEQDADCYAIRSLIRQGKFTIKDVENVQKDMRKFARATLYHAPGHDRAASLIKCIEY